MIRTPLEGALLLFDKGYKVFPIIPNGKKPAIKNWQEWAETATRLKVEQYGRANQGHNWGVHCSTDLFIVDLDNKKGGNGKESFNQLIREAGHENKLICNFAVDTPTEGVHLYFEGPGKNSADLLGSGIDTRGEGGYVVAPGSRIGGIQYEIIDFSVRHVKDKIFPCPSWIKQKLHDLRKKKPLTINDTETIREGERDNTFTRIGGALRRLGASEDAILYTLRDFNTNKCESPLPDSDLERIASSVSRYKPEEAEAASAFIEIKGGINLSVVRDLNPKSIPTRGIIMKGRYEGRLVSALLAPGGVGKSTLVFLDAMAMTSGITIHPSYDIHKHGNVWIHNSEDPLVELHRRVVAMAYEYNVPFHEFHHDIFLTSGRNFNIKLVGIDGGKAVVNKGLIEEIIDIINTKKIVLFIVDPLVNTHSVNENDNSQMSVVIDCYQEIAEKTGCAIGIVHHTHKGGGRAESRGEMDIGRGASALVNAARSVHTLSNFTPKEIEKFGLPGERSRSYARLDVAKTNNHMPYDKPVFYEKVGVDLINGDNVGVLRCVNLVEISDDQKREDQRINRRDLAVALSTFMNVGDKMTITSIVKAVTTMPLYAHILGGKSESQSRRVVADLVDKNISYRDKLFKYEAESIVSKAGETQLKHWIKCEKLDDFLR